jgi:hypothetical protein
MKRRSFNAPLIEDPVHKTALKSAPPTPIQVGLPINHSSTAGQIVLTAKSFFKPAVLPPRAVAASQKETNNSSTRVSSPCLEGQGGNGKVKVQNSASRNNSRSRSLTMADTRGRFHHLFSPTLDGVGLVADNPSVHTEGSVCRLDALEDFLNPRRGSVTLLDSDETQLPTSVFQVMEHTKPLDSGTSITSPNQDVLNEKIKDTRESASRQFHNTMRQGAPKRSPIKLQQMSAAKPEVSRNPLEHNRDPTQDFKDGIKTLFAEIMPKLRCWNGSIKLEAQFGRFYLRKPPINLTLPEIEGHGKEVEYIYRWLNNSQEGSRSKETVKFTNILSTYADDIDYLVAMKDKSGQNMWYHNPTGNNPPHWFVSYEMFFLDERDMTRFQLSVDAETFVARIWEDNPTVFGVINVHCVKRQWDFKISATGTKSLDAKYDEFAKNLIASLYIQ